MIEMDEQQKGACKKALRLLEKMDRTEKGLYEKLLQSGFSEDASSFAIAYVKSYGYINDKRYAVNYILHRIHEKSRQKIFQELQQKRIDREIMQEAWEEVSEREEPDERKLLRKTIEKKYESGTQLDEKAMRRLFGYLARRGFHSGDIFSVLEEMNIHQN